VFRISNAWQWLPSCEAYCGSRSESVEISGTSVFEYEADTWFTVGWMTFAPEWLTGNPNLDTSNWMYL
jgi:hypothetical protein